MQNEKEYVIHAAVNAPVYCQFRVKAKNKKEALAKAMAPAPGHGDKKFGANEWDSEIWQNGNWIKNVAWSEAEDFRVLGVDRDNGTKTING